MAKYIQRGEVLDYLNSSDSKISAGDVVALGGKVSVAATDIKAGEVGAVAVTGVFEFDKASGEIAVGDILYYDAENENVTTSASGILCGYAVEGRASADTTVRVNLAQVSPVGGLTKITTADATDATSVIALANANKVAFNALIDALNAAAGSTD